MTFTITYKPLFEVNILHKYYLNKGLEDFFSMDDSNKEKQLTDFSLSTLFSIIPTKGTKRKLEGHNLVFKTTNNGFVVWAHISEENEVTPLITINDSLEFTFLLKLIDHTFYNFTNLDILNVGKLLFLSNKRLANEAPTFPLIKTNSSSQPVNDNYVLSDDSQAAELSNLSNSEKDGLFGIVRIHMKGETASLNVTTAGQKICNPYRIFQIVFDNRK